MIEYKVVPIDYFMDKLQHWEVSNLLENLNFSFRTTWEQTRMMMYVTAQVNSTKRLSAKDILKFPWEEETHETNISNDDIKRLRNRVKSLEQLNVDKNIKSE